MARPVYLQHRTYLVTVGMAESCQERPFRPSETRATRASHLAPWLRFHASRCMRAPVRWHRARVAAGSAVYGPAEPPDLAVSAPAAPATAASAARACAPGQRPTAAEAVRSCQGCHARPPAAW